MIHNLAELIWTPAITILEYGTAAYILAKGLIETLRGVVNFLLPGILDEKDFPSVMRRAALGLSFLVSVYSIAAGRLNLTPLYFAFTYIAAVGLLAAVRDLCDLGILLLSD
jgi:hypothetical protein